MSSTVDLRPVVRKQLDRITAKDRARILRRLAALADDPRPAGVTALAAADDSGRRLESDRRLDPWPARSRCIWLP